MSASISTVIWSASLKSVINFSRTVSSTDSMCARATACNPPMRPASARVTASVASRMAWLVKCGL